MKVDFNNLRVMALKAHDRLVTTLNEHRTDSGFSIHVDCDQIESDLEDLRQYIGSIAMVHEPGDANFKDVFSEHYPGETAMVVFNPEEGE